MCCTTHWSFRSFRFFELPTGGHRKLFCRKAMLPFGSHQAPLYSKDASYCAPCQPLLRRSHWGKPLPDCCHCCPGEGGGGGLRPSPCPPPAAPFPLLAAQWAASSGRHGLSTEQFPVSAYVGSSKNLKDLKASRQPFPLPLYILRPHLALLADGGGVGALSFDDLPSLYILKRLSALVVDRRAVGALACDLPSLARTGVLVRPLWQPELPACLEG